MVEVCGVLSLGSLALGFRVWVWGLGLRLFQRGPEMFVLAVAALLGFGILCRIPLSAVQVAVPQGGHRGALWRDATRVPWYLLQTQYSNYMYDNMLMRHERAAIACAVLFLND